MTPREERGLQIAATSKIKQVGDYWLVPSQSRRFKYHVILGEKPYCSCPDFEHRNERCKHIYAVEFRIKFETSSDGTTKTTKTLRVSYGQNWPAYNAAQTQEKEYFQIMLSSLCQTLPEPARTHGKAPGGRKPLSFADMTFAATYKVYSTFSARRFTSDLREACANGLISKVPHFNSVLNYLERKELGAALRSLIVESAKPLSALETQFAVDASGFSTTKKNDWYDARYGKTKSPYSPYSNSWVKCHIMTGVKTNVVTACEISRSGDAAMFAPLVQLTAQNFQIKEVAADKAYASRKNFQLMDSLGGTALIPFRRTNVMDAKNELWNKMLHYYLFNREEFLTRYHIRSNVESTFSAIKAKFGGYVRSKGIMAQENEVLAKVLCHNLCCVIQSMFEFGISPKFVDAGINS